MKYVYLVNQVSDDQHYPSEMLSIHASRASAQSVVDAYIAKCAERNGLPVDHEDFWDTVPYMYVQQCEVLD